MIVGCQPLGLTHSFIPVVEPLPPEAMFSPGKSGLVALILGVRMREAAAVGAADSTCESLAQVCVQSKVGQSFIQADKSEVSKANTASMAHSQPLYVGGRTDPLPARRQIAAKRAKAPEDASQPLRLELLLVPRLSEIHTGPLGPLQNFTTRLRSGLARFLEVPANRLAILSVRGDRITLPLALLGTFSNVTVLLDLDTNSSSAHNHDIAQDPSDLSTDFRRRDVNKDGVLDPEEFYYGEFRARDLNGDGVVDPSEFSSRKDVLAKRAGHGVNDAARRAKEGGPMPFDRKVREVRAQSMVDFEILPGPSITDPTPRMLQARLTGLLTQTSRTGELAAVLGGARVREPQVLDPWEPDRVIVSDSATESAAAPQARFGPAALTAAIWVLLVESVRVQPEGRYCDA